MQCLCQIICNNETLKLYEVIPLTINHCANLCTTRINDITYKMTSMIHR